ncbi:MAG: Na+/H+ antiporter NhaC family protein [Oscillibacter sp.]
MAAIVLFCLALLVCIVLGTNILYALLAGLVIFALYGKKQGFSWKELGKMICSGVKTSASVLLVFPLIGILTAFWRACGTLPFIICCAVDLIRPEILLLMTFLLNCGVSMLTGTAFGTAATMGTICVSVGISMGMDPVLLGGAMLSGVYFGDRCSPVSTSALLVSELTETNIYDNIKLHAQDGARAVSSELRRLCGTRHGEKRQRRGGRAVVALRARDDASLGHVPAGGAHFDPVGPTREREKGDVGQHSGGGRAVHFPAASGRGDDPQDRNLRLHGVGRRGRRDAQRRRHHFSRCAWR